jgi:hypothetical protein
MKRRYDEGAQITLVWKSAESQSIWPLVHTWFHARELCLAFNLPYELATVILRAIAIQGCPICKDLESIFCGDLCLSCLRIDNTLTLSCHEAFMRCEFCYQSHCPCHTRLTFSCTSRDCSLTCQLCHNNRVIK